MTKRIVLSLILALAGLGVIDCGHPSTSTGGGVGGNSSTSGGAGGNGGAAATCPPGQTQCTLGCKDLTGDPGNCGVCEKICAAGVSCSNGQCSTSSCQGTLASCGGACVDTQTNNSYCGSCSSACAAGQTCVGGVCTCSGGQTACSGVCKDTLTDANNCGTSCTKCPTGATCQAGSCQCQSGLTTCNGACVNFQNDGANCGTCGHACTGTQTCSGGVCGNTCAKTTCGSSCVDTTNDPQHCGQCATVCPTGQSCSNSACTCADSTQTSCSGTCTNAQTDSSNCGTCGTVCTGGKTCSAGICACPTGTTLCGTQCLNVKGTDIANCGACGTICAGGQACSSGTCSGCLTAGYLFCNGSCVDSQTDKANCGSCANQCAADATSCTAGKCVGGTTQTSCPDKVYSDTYTPGYNGSFHSAAVSQVNSMSNTDREAQMQGTACGNATTQNYTDYFRSADTTAVRGFRFRDGPRGVNLDAPVQSGTTGGTATVFPVAMGRAASFDLDLEYRVGQAIGDEALAASQTMILAPTVNILRHPFWGRAQETYGEDPFQLGRLGSAFTVGVQKYIGACAKHYAANNIENGRGSETSNMQDEQTLREIYARHYEMIIKDGGVSCIMAAYNQVSVAGAGGVHCTQNAHLLTDILRTDFGFQGFTMSDWWAMPGGQVCPGSASSEQTYATGAVNAGLDMELPWSLNFSQLDTIRAADTSGGIGGKIINSATRILEQKLRFKANGLNGPWGLATPSTSYSSPKIAYNAAEQAHIDLAYEAALKSMVLLKNDNATLPINRSTVHKVAVIGANVSYTTSAGSKSTPHTANFATWVRTGDEGSSRVLNDSAHSLAPFAGIQAVAAALGGGITVVSGATAADAQSAAADFNVVVAGLTPQDEGEEYTAAGDRTTCDLDAKANTGVQNALIAAVAALGKPMVVVLEGGSVINVAPYASVPAIVMAWYPGMVGGKALGELLFGANASGSVNFSGKLPITWPKDCVNDEPHPFSGGTTTTMNYDIGYRYFDRNSITPQYAFGYGLSYTTYKYLNLQTPCSNVTKNGIIELDVTVQNSGTADGIETVLVFAKYPGSTAPRRSIKELKGFARVPLAAGQSKQVQILVRASDLKYWNSTTNAWTVDTGNVEFDVGPSADNLPLTVTVPVN